MLVDTLLIILFLGTLFAIAYWLMAGGPAARRVIDFVTGHYIYFLGAIAVVVVAVIVLVVWSAISQGPKTTAAWKDFADRRDLVYESRNSAPPFGSVSGEIDGVGCVVRVQPETGWFELAVSPFGMPVGLTISRRGKDSVGSSLRRWFTKQASPDTRETFSGDDDFDVRFYTVADDERALAWLDESRRSLVADILSDTLSADHIECGLSVSAGALRWKCEGPPSLEELELAFDRLMRVAAELSR